MNDTRLTRRRLLTRSAQGAAALGLAGMGAATATQAFAAAPAATTTLPFFTVENDPASIAWLNSALASYQAHGHPGFHLDEVFLNDENRLERLLVGFSTKTDLGIFVPEQTYITDWANAGYLMPLDHIVSAIGPGDFIEGTRVVVNGHDYAMPYQANAWGIWCRTDLLAKVGMKPPRTYDELLAAAKAVTRGGTYGIAMAVGPVPQMTVRFFSPFVYQSGWDYFDKEGHLTFDQPEVLDAVKRFVAVMRYAPPALYNATFVDILNFYIAGRVAMAVFPGRLGVNLAAKAPALAAQTTVVPLPAGPFMTGKILGGALSYYCIDRATHNPAAALDFLQYITTGKRALDFSLTVPGHLLPPLKSVARLSAHVRSPFMDKYGAWVRSQASWVPNTIYPVLNMGSVNQHRFKKVVNVCPWASQIWGNPTIDGTMFQEILLKGTSPDAAWKVASAQMKRVADSWKRAHPTWHPTA